MLAEMGMRMKAYGAAAWMREIWGPGEGETVMICGTERSDDRDGVRHASVGRLVTAGGGGWRPMKSREWEDGERRMRECVWG